MWPWAPGDYENWEGKLIKLGGHNINLGGTNGQINDFTLASQNLGGKCPPPCPTHRAPMGVARGVMAPPDFKLVGSGGA